MLENGHSEKEDKRISKSKKWFGAVCIAVIILVLLGVVLFFDHRAKIKKENDYFDQILEQYFYNFNVAFPDSESYSFESLDAYCMEDENKKGVIHFYVNAKYKAYIDISEEWDDIDEVSYGDNGELENSYSLSWDSIEGFEDVNESFNKAVKEGTHKTYTIKEINDLINNNKPKE